MNWRQNREQNEFLGTWKRLCLQYRYNDSSIIIVSTVHWPNIDLMLRYRLRRLPNIKLTLVQDLVISRIRLNLEGPLRGLRVSRKFVMNANTRYLTNIGSMSVHRLRRWPNIDPTLGQCLVFDVYAGLIHLVSVEGIWLREAVYC